MLIKGYASLEPDAPLRQSKVMTAVFFAGKFLARAVIYSAVIDFWHAVITTTPFNFTADTNKWSPSAVISPGVVNVRK